MKQPEIGQPSNEPAPLGTPAVPDYELLKRIGGGAYGDVWLARSKATGALRAAKIVWRHRFEDDRPFQREFEGIQKFERISREHPSQLALFHIGRNEAEGYFYYVMELADDLKAEGGMRKAECRRATPSTPHSALPTPHAYVPRTLRADLANGRLPAARVLEIGLALTEALGHLHENGLVHRDVKPSNVIFVKGRPKLADIGLVTDASDQCSIVGTEGYLPPEGPGTPQADIFALGKVLYEAATGRDRREFPKLPEALRSWPDAKPIFELNEIILKACAGQSRERYDSVETMLEELRALQGGKSIKRRRAAQWWWVAGRRAAAGLAAVGVIVAAVFILVRERPQPQFSSDGPVSTNSVANALCRRAMDIIRDDIYEKFGEAYTNLLDAVKADPQFARPWIGRLELRARESFPGLAPMGTNELQLITSNLQKLLPHSAPAYCAQSFIEFFNWDFPQAEECAQKAIAADPNYELAHTFYGFMLTHWGKERLDEARKQLAQSESLLSGKATIPRCLGHIAYVERDFHRAITNYAIALALESHHAPAIHNSGRAFQAMGDYTNAVAYFRRERQLFARTEADRLKSDERYNRLLKAYEEGGPKGYWEFYWDQTGPRSGDYYWKAVVRMHLSDTNGAMSWLEASYTHHERIGGFQTALTGLLFDEEWDGLRDHPEFKALLDKVGFTRVMYGPGQRGGKQLVGR